jgi:transposase
MIKTFQQFIESKEKEEVNEGLFDKLTGKHQIAELQGEVIKACERSFAEFPKKFSDGKSVLEYVKSYAERKYKEYVTSKLATSFEKWWEEFSKYYEPLMDEIIKDYEKGNNKEIKNELGDEKDYPTISDIDEDTEE